MWYRWGQYGYTMHVFVDCAQNGTLQIDTNDENAC